MDPLHIENSVLEGVKLITPPTIFEDFRGDYVEIYNQKIYQDAGIEQVFVQDDYATSRQHVLRGLHGDEKTQKLVKCLHGVLYFVVVNNDESSEQYKKWCSYTLSAQNRLQILVPPKFGIGYLVMSESAIFHYKQTTFYWESKQFTLKWNDPSLKIRWPIKDPILSERDA